MSHRDEFSPKTKRALQLRAGHLCSFRGCLQPTAGPSHESPEAVNMTGRAAHIHGTASGPGSRRYLTSMTPKERKDFSNAIWLCAYHADLIDNDEATYTADDLRAMKREHEAYAQALGNGLDQGAFERGVRAFVADDDTVAAGARLQAIFSDAIALIQDQRTQRLRARPIDQTKWNA